MNHLPPGAYYDDALRTYLVPHDPRWRLDRYREKSGDSEATAADIRQAAERFADENAR